MTGLPSLTITASAVTPHSLQVRPAILSLCQSIPLPSQLVCLHPPRAIRTMRYSSGGYDIEAWIERLDGSERFPEHRETHKLAVESGKADGLREAFLECEEGAKRQADLAFTSMPKTDEEDQVQIRGAAVDQLCKIEMYIQQGICHIGLIGDGCHSSRHWVQTHDVEPSIRERYPGGLTSTSNPCAAYQADVCRFQWRYHTRAKLAIMGIIEEEEALPASPAQAPGASPSNGTAAKRERSSDEEDDKIEVVKRVKTEKTGLGSRSAPIPVSELDPPKRGIRARAGVIDLTGE
ncbi:uncharacterized protein MKK02DRAFT_29003 [Dioszegia hungarica]|uniref:Uncharacterized protein n=1 Tax=Dioszegia hungarica TaxID=4972 RepID=A0AA38LSH8_9TREE|nr:uncharacterized protein MKK02DRAFT_29003 [Dioszegia hungarica]KAI9633373.1 hypothetical protein MKK02DRAFT_29003 [Dioszegia hungarica]